MKALDKGNPSRSTEQFLTLMADLDEAAQERMAEWYRTLREAGFTGTQTPGLPYHISLATFPTDEEETAVRVMEKAAGERAPVPVHISHVGIFAPGKVLFGGPELNPALLALHDACEIHPDPARPWTPHVTLLIDEPETVSAAVPVWLRCFQPFFAEITRLHLCAFWPTREIGAVMLGGK